MKIRKNFDKTDYRIRKISMIDNKILKLCIGVFLIHSILSSEIALSNQCGRHVDRSANAIEIEITRNGKALIPIVVAKTADQRTLSAANSLADQLRRISGAAFEVITGNPDKGIVIGTVADFKELFPLKIDQNDMTINELYYLRTHNKGVNILGVSPLAVENAVWDILQRIGYRQFFATSKWEYVPQQSNIKLKLDIEESPDYINRGIWYAYWNFDYEEKPYREWCKKNRTTYYKDTVLKTGHIYENILIDKKNEFKKHPEYFALVDGKRSWRWDPNVPESSDQKFCISNLGLRKLVIRWALEYMSKHPDAHSISMEPSDGGAWCECKKCAEMGSETDRAIILANEVAEALSERFGNKIVGLYAYHKHSPPPNVNVHPNVFVYVATAFIGTTNCTPLELVDKWHKKGAKIGIREYHSVATWDRELPGSFKAQGGFKFQRARIGTINYLKSFIPEFHKKSAIAWTGEGSNSWGPHGLGYYICAQLLWDSSKANQVDIIIDDFLSKCFGTAKKPMVEFYNLMDGSNYPLLTNDLIGRMYRCLDKAREMTTDPKVLSRLDDLVLYMYYVELFVDYMNSDGNQRQNNFEQIIRHVYRMRDRQMVHMQATYRDIVIRDPKVSIPPNARLSVPEAVNEWMANPLISNEYGLAPKLEYENGVNPWKSSKPFTDIEINDILKKAIDKYTLIEFKPLQFSDNLVNISNMSSIQNRLITAPGVRGFYNYWTFKPTNKFIFNFESGADIKFEITPGALTLSKSNIISRVFAYYQKINKKQVFNFSDDNSNHIIDFDRLNLEQIELINTSGQGIKLSWNYGLPAAIKSTPEYAPDFYEHCTLYFYVPKGTKIVGGYASTGSGIVKNANGVPVHTFGVLSGHFAIPVQNGQDGNFWKIENNIGDKFLMTVPPYFFRTPDEGMVPVEIAKRDYPKVY